MVASCSNHTEKTFYKFRRSKICDSVGLNDVYFTITLLGSVLGCAKHVLNIFRSDVTVIGQQIHWQVHNSVFVYLTFESDKKKRSSHKYILNVKLSK